MISFQSRYTGSISMAVVPERSEGATKGLRIINPVDPCVLKSNFFRL